MGAYASKAIEIAKAELGYLEKSKAAYMQNQNIVYDKFNGAGYDNYTKYALELDRLNWYNTPKNGYPWCAVFVDWLLIKAFGAEKAAEMKNHGIYDAGCVGAVESYINAGLFSKSPKIGDQIFFKDSDGEPCHTGIVVDVDSDIIYTIEGNTSSAEGVEANGGGVFKKRYYRDFYRILGYGHPRYDVEDDVMTGEEIYKALNEYLTSLPCPEWAYEEYADAQDRGITDGTNPRMFCSRLEAAIMCKRAVEDRKK